MSLSPSSFVLLSLASIIACWHLRLFLLTIRYHIVKNGKWVTSISHYFHDGTAQLWALPGCLICLFAKYFCCSVCLLTKPFILFLQIKKCRVIYIADWFKLDVFLDICQKSHSADYQGIRGPREVGGEKVKDVEIKLVIDGNVVFDSYSWTLWRVLSSWVFFLMVDSWWFDKLAWVVLFWIIWGKRWRSSVACQFSGCKLMDGTFEQGGSSAFWIVEVCRALPPVGCQK